VARPRRCCTWGLAILLGCALALALACSSRERDGEPTLDRLRRQGVARVGFANEAPYAYVDSEDGRLTGEAPEIARAVLARMGVTKIEGVLTEFGSLIPGLKAGRFDLIAAGMYVTPERCREVAFSEPTYSIGGAFLVVAGNPRDLHSYRDVRADPEVRLGVMAGAVERGYARKAGIPDRQVVTFPDAPSAVAGLLAGRVDAFAATALTARDLLAKARSDSLALAEPFDDPVFEGRPARGYGAFAFRKQDAALRDAFDEELAGFIGSAQHRALVRPFGFTENDLPRGMTTAELCAPPGGPAA
jgi:polar amino acid transport system substrate-binding protein